MHSAWCHFSRVGAGAGRTGVENRGAASMRSVRAPAHRAARRSTTPIQPRRADAGAPSAWACASRSYALDAAVRPEHAERRAVVRRERVQRQRGRARVPHAHRAAVRARREAAPAPRRPPPPSASHGGGPNATPPPTRRARRRASRPARCRRRGRARPHAHGAVGVAGREQPRGRRPRPSASGASARHAATAAATECTHSRARRPTA